MPLFSYVCPQCGHKFDRLVLSPEIPEIRCPECGAVAIKQMGCIAHFVFKGNLA